MLWFVGLLKLTAGDQQYYYHITSGGYCVGVETSSGKVIASACDYVNSPSSNTQLWTPDGATKSLRYALDTTNCMHAQPDSIGDRPVSLAPCTTSGNGSFFFDNTGGGSLGLVNSGECLGPVNHSGAQISTVATSTPSNCSSFRFILGPANNSAASLIGIGCFNVSTYTVAAVPATADACAAAATASGAPYFGLASDQCIMTITRPSTASTSCGTCSAAPWQFCGNSTENIAFFYQTPVCSAWCWSCSSSTLCVQCTSGYTANGDACTEGPPTEAPTHAPSTIPVTASPTPSVLPPTSPTTWTCVGGNGTAECCNNEAPFTWQLTPALIPPIFADSSPINLGNVACLAGGYNGNPIQDVYCTNASLVASGTSGWIKIPNSLASPRVASSVFYGVGWVAVASGQQGYSMDIAQITSAVKGNIDQLNLTWQHQYIPQIFYSSPSIAFNGTPCAAGMDTELRSFCYNISLVGSTFVVTPFTGPSLVHSHVYHTALHFASAGQWCVLGGVSGYMNDSYVMDVECVSDDGIGEFTVKGQFPSALQSASNLTLGGMPCVGGGGTNQVWCGNMSVDGNELNWITMPNFILTRANDVSWTVSSPAPTPPTPTSSPTTYTPTSAPTSPVRPPQLEWTCITGTDSTTWSTECLNIASGTWSLVSTLTPPQRVVNPVAFNLGPVSCIGGGSFMATGTSRSVYCTNASMITQSGSTDSAWVIMPYSFQNDRVGSTVIYGTGWIGVVGGQQANSFESTRVGLASTSIAESVNVPWVVVSSLINTVSYAVVVPINGTPCVVNSQAMETRCLSGDLTPLGSGGKTSLIQWTSGPLLPIGHIGGAALSFPEFDLWCVVGGLDAEGQNAMTAIDCISQTAGGNWTTMFDWSNAPRSSANVSIYGLPCVVGSGVQFKQVWCGNMTRQFNGSLSLQWIQMNSLTTYRPSFVSFTLSDPNGATNAPTPIGSPAGSKLSAGEVAGIIIGLIILMAGVFLCWWILRKRDIKLNDLTSKLKKMKSEHQEGPKDPREVALNGVIKLCEQTLKGPKTTSQNKLFLQYVIAGAKEDKRSLTQPAATVTALEGRRSSPEAEMVMLPRITTAEEKGRVFDMEDFQHSTFLSQGEGGSADLYKEKGTGTQVVIKVPHNANELETEVRVWRAIGLHPNVARMIGIVNLHDKPRGIVMEYYPGGSLDSAGHEFAANELHHIAIDLARGLQCLHAHKVIHRDLAARNILVARDRRVVLTDFGLSRKLDENDTYKMVSDTKLPWRTLAPELILTENSGRVFTEKTDIWALGVTLWELATKKSAYAEIAEKDAFKVLKEKIGNGVVTLDLTPIIMNHEKLAAALVGCFNRDPALRPTAEQLRWLLKDDSAAEASDRTNYIAAVNGAEYA